MTTITITIMGTATRPMPRRRVGMPMAMPTGTTMGTAITTITAAATKPGLH